MKLRSYLLSCALGLCLAQPAFAEYELSYAHVDEIDGKTTHGVMGSWVRPIERWRESGVYSEVLLGSIIGRDGFPGRDDETVFFAGAGVRKHFGGFFIGIGGVVLDHTNSLLSSSGQFVTSLGYARGHFVLAFRHISNGNTSGNNDGENLLSLGYRW